jgi:DNA-directed RNA polymerase specialized sigma24 family protein
MPTAEEFDEFYVSTRRGLVHQTFALTGDLVASRTAVRDAYVAARHHWDKLGRSADPESWVRPRAWSIAQRRHSARPWHREKQVGAEQARTLEALQSLPDSQRRTLILSHLTDLPVADVAREVGRPLPVIADLFDAGTATLAEALECDPTDLGDRLRVLGEAADTVKLPRPTIIRRNGLRRRRNFAVVGSLVIAGITVGAGAFVAITPAAAPLPRASSLVTRAMLLSPTQIAALAPQQTWTTVSTDNNTQSKSGINTMCQAARFADPDGLGTLVRKFTSSGTPARSLVQTVEISNSPGAARQAYATTLGWYAGCTAARIQLVDAYTVTGLADQAQILRMRIPGSPDRSYVVGIARTGALTTSSVITTQSTAPLPASLLTGALASSVTDLCTSKVKGTCPSTVATTAAAPPSSGEAPGMLATADLPEITGVDYPWVGTKPTPATSVNNAATTCDNASFARSGSTGPLGRSFLIPAAKLPARFGVSETIGKFSSPTVAAQFVSAIEAKMKSCPKRELSSIINDAEVKTTGDTSYGLWRLKNQVNKNQETVTFWMGVARVGSYVAQVNLTPVDKYDVSETTFAAMLLRARARLYEVSK